jgi:hypothetical protein
MPDGPLGRLHPEGDTGQGRPHPVVDIAAQPAALILHRKDEALPSTAEVVRESGGVQYQPDLGGRGLQESLVTPVQSLAPATGPQLTQGSASVPDREGGDGPRRLAHGHDGRVATVGSEHRRHVGEAKRGGQCADECLERAVVVDLLQRPGEPHGGRRRVVTLAVQEPVDEAVQARAEQLDDQDDHDDKGDDLLIRAGVLP